MVNLEQTVLSFVMDVYQNCVIFLMGCVITKPDVTLVIITLNPAMKVRKLKLIKLCDHFIIK